jgi:chaperonin GroEL
MVAKRLHFTESSRSGLLEGVKQVAGMVKQTMGPRGLNIIIERQHQKPLVTKDGVTVAEYITLEDGVEEMGSQLVVDAAQKTADIAGDGTTTACVLAEAIFVRGVDELGKSRSVIKMREGMDEGMKLVETFINDQCRVDVDDVEQLVNVATIASNHDSALGRMIGEAMNKTGKDGCIIVQEGGEDNIEYTDGMQVRSGMKTPMFANQPNRSQLCEFKEAWVFVSNKPLNSARELLPLLQSAANEDKPLVIFAKDFSAEVMQMCVVNRMQQKISICCVKIPEFADHQTEIARDIAAVTGATAITQEEDYDIGKIGTQGARKWSDFIGVVSLFRSTRDETLLIQDAEKKDEGYKERIQARLDQATEQKANLKQADNYQKDKLQRRIASLSGGVAKLIISANTESESGQKKARVEDALYAVKAAAEHGVVAGGGVALFYAGMAVADRADGNTGGHEDFNVGMNIIAAACKAPLEQIARNADEKFVHTVPDKIANHYKNTTTPKEGEGVRKELFWHGWDADINEYGDMNEFKVIDPSAVPITALKNAVSVSKLLLNTGGVVELLTPEQLDKGIEGHTRGPVK